MRRILVDYGRGHYAAKRGGRAGRVFLEEARVISKQPAADVVALDEALSRLAGFDPQQAFAAWQELHQEIRELIWRRQRLTLPCPTIKEQRMRQKQLPGRPLQPAPNYWSLAHVRFNAVPSQTLANHKTLSPG